ncbi:MAG: VacJ family lipoprotein [Desulfuromonadales bacterium]|nr:VacJ family lipoprotein [Desulfuromonadales bacterium]
MSRVCLAVFAKFAPVLIVVVFLLNGCAATKQASTEAPEHEAVASLEADPAFDLEAEFEEQQPEPVFDPLSGYNRVMTQVNDRAYFWVLKPVATGYSAVMPEEGRLAMARFFRNLKAPIHIVNNLLQLKPDQACTELFRFVVNSTVGLLGLADPSAESLGMQPYPEDFGQTLGHYGVGSGFHLVLPLLGPSNLRDTVGMVPDHYLKPVTHVEDSKTRTTIMAYAIINRTSLHIGEYESLKKDAVDLYPFLRDSYEQRRKQQIKE